MTDYVTGAIIDEEYLASTFAYHWGAKYKEGDSKYILIKFNNGVGNETAVAGQMLAGMDSAYERFEGTNDLNDPDATLNRIFGQMMVAPSDGNGVWCLYEGANSIAIPSDGSVVEGGNFMLAAAVVGGIGALAGVATRAGVARAADDATPELGIGDGVLQIPVD